MSQSWTPMKEGDVETFSRHILIFPHHRPVLLLVERGMEGAEHEMVDTNVHDGQQGEEAVVLGRGEIPRRFGQLAASPMPIGGS